MLDKKFDATENFLYKRTNVGLADTFKSMFKRLDRRAAHSALFSVLWYSSLPCFDLNGVTSQWAGEKAVMKSCSWGGVEVSCAAIFDTFPTDQVSTETFC